MEFLKNDKERKIDLERINGWNLKKRYRKEKEKNI